MLYDKNSSIRMRGFRILCKLSKWDIENKINENINLLLSVLEDEKPTIVRQCLKALNILLLYKPELSNTIEIKLRSLNSSIYNENMKPLIQKDIDYILNHL